MEASRKARRDLIQYITFPVPSLKDIPKPGTLGKEQRLETIIANLDKQHQATRLKIIEAAKTRLQEHHASNQEDEADKMDTSAPMGASDAMEVFLSNLNTPCLDSMEDPCCSPSTAHLLEAMSVGVPQKTPPIEIQLAKETLDRIALYDTHALPARKFYADALSRSRGEFTGSVGGGGGAATDPRRSSIGGGGASDSRRPSIGGPTSAPPSRASSGTFTTSGRVDPRLVNRSGSSGTFQQTPAQSPAEREARRPSDPRLRGR